MICRVRANDEGVGLRILSLRDVDLVLSVDTLLSLTELEEENTVIDDEYDDAMHAPSRFTARAASATDYSRNYSYSQSSPLFPKLFGNNRRRPNMHTLYIT